MGFAPEFSGPGMARHQRGVRVMQPLNEWAAKHVDDALAKDQADHVVWLLEQAFKAGREDMARELRLLIGAAAEDHRR